MHVKELSITPLLSPNTRKKGPLSYIAFLLLDKNLVHTFGIVAALVSLQGIPVYLLCI